MYSSLDSVDLVYTAPDGRTRWLQTDHRRPAQIEAEPELSLIYAAFGTPEVIVGGSTERWRERFAEVEEVGAVACGLCMPYENGKKLFLARA